MQTPVLSAVWGVLGALSILAAIVAAFLWLLYLIASRTPYTQVVRAEETVREIVRQYLAARDLGSSEYFTVVIYGDGEIDHAWVNVIPTTQHAVIYFNRKHFDFRFSPTLDEVATLLKKKGFSISQQQVLGAAAA